MQAQAIEFNSVHVFLSFATKDAPLVDAFRNYVGRQYPDVELLDHAVKDSYQEPSAGGCSPTADA